MNHLVHPNDSGLNLLFKYTVVTGDQQAVVTDDFQIRKLTPLECWRLQSFPSEGDNLSTEWIAAADR